MDVHVALYCLLIFAARVIDVSLGTIRTIMIVNGRKFAAWLLGFVELLVWVFVAAHVITSVKDNLWYAVFYAMGFATGGYVGMTIEGWIAIGERALFVFSRKGDEVTRQLRAAGLPVTSWPGEGRDGPITVVFVKVPRRDVRTVVDDLQTLDPDCFYTIERVDGSRRPTMVPRTGWRAGQRKGK